MRDELAVWLDELSGCLALLINLVEHNASWRQQLRQVALADPGSAGSAAGSARVQLIPLLCVLLGAMAPLGGRAQASTTNAAASSLGRRLSLGSGEVTLDCLESVDDGGARCRRRLARVLLPGGQPARCGCMRDSPHTTPSRRANVPNLACRRGVHCGSVRRNPAGLPHPGKEGARPPLARPGRAGLLLASRAPAPADRATHLPTRCCPIPPTRPAGLLRGAHAGGGAAAGRQPGAGGGGCGALPALLRHSG